MQPCKLAHSEAGSGLSETQTAPEHDALVGLDPAVQLERLVRQRTGGAIDRLRIEIVGGEIRLSGSCRTFYAKQLAQQALLHARPGQAVKNLIEVA